VAAHRVIYLQVSVVSTASNSDLFLSSILPSFHHMRLSFAVFLCLSHFIL